MNIENCFRLPTLLIALALSSPALSSDYYYASTNEISLREVVVSGSVYQNVSVKLGAVQQSRGGYPARPTAVFDFSTGILESPFVRVDNYLFTNVAATIDEITRVGNSFGINEKLPSGELYADFKRNVFAAWEEKLSYMPEDEYQRQLLLLQNTNTCYGFTSTDIIPKPTLNHDWGAKVGKLFPMRKPKSLYRTFNKTYPIPAPFTRVETDANVYAQSDQRVLDLQQALRERLSDLNSVNADRRIRNELKDFLLRYSSANALSDGLLVNWSHYSGDNVPVHYEVMFLTQTLVNTFDEVSDMLTVPERRQVGAWLNRIVTTTLKGSWAQNKQDNKAYFRSQLALMWGIITGDSGLVANAIYNFKHALREMRPDGSFINESSRGGSANKYNSTAADHVISMAVIMEENLGIPASLFNYQGKSVWTAASRVVFTFDNQVLAASQYGKSCESGSFGSVTEPDSRWRNLWDIAYLRIFFKRDGDEVLKSQLKKYPWGNDPYPQMLGIDLVDLVGN